jgi:DNA-3-methyladenine glycosylase I
MGAYHDEEWGRPQHDRRMLFELLTLEGAQAGLSWSTILRRRAGYRAAFAEFDVARVAEFDDATVARLLTDGRIIRNRQKIASTIENARRILDVERTEGSFGEYLWSFVGGQPLVHRFARVDEVPPESSESRALSVALRKRGFGFVGPTICYALMQAAGLVNDHLVSCPAWELVERAG